MILTFENGKFILHNAEPSKVSLDGFIKNFATNTFQTTNPIKAARFRRYADSKCERLFNKLLLKRHPFPAGGLISPMELKPFQREQGIPFILERNRSYLAHEAGLGKSAQVIVAVNSKPGQTLIICPSFLKINWAREITKWTVGFPEIKMIGEDAKEFNHNADYIICSDSMVFKTWVLELLAKIKFRFVAVDEAHRFKNSGALRTTAVFGGRIMEKGKVKVKSNGLIYRSEHSVMLSGTPLLRSAIDLWPVLYAMAPETIQFMNYQEFGYRYTNPFEDSYGVVHFQGSNNEAELNSRIMGTFMQRITKADVLKELPSKLREVIFIGGDKLHPEVALMNQQLTRTLQETEVEKPESLKDYAIVNHEIGLAKVKMVAAYVLNVLEYTNESILLFAHHIDVVERLKSLLEKYNPLVINGGVENTERTKIQDKFQNKQCRIIIGNLGAMNLGLTLTAGNRAMFCEFDWNYATNEQGEDRIHRIGQTESVLIQYFVLTDTLDEIKMTSMLSKKESSERVIG